MRLFRRSSKILVVALAFLVLSPVASVAQIAWVKDFNAALKQASKEKKYIFLDVSASW
ncbi:MAG: hypothetical protein QUT30_02520 [Acidobacteriota bacterium]|nr:hypothetical protein [Acidobacteriota bacterium]